MPSPDPAGGSDLASFLREHRDDILDDLDAALLSIPRLRELPTAVRADHLPALLDRIAAEAASIARGGSAAPPDDEAVCHADHRLDEGLDLTDVVAEYGVLRRCVLRRLAATAGTPHGEAVLTLDAAIDVAIERAVARYTEARERTLRALDRVAEAAIESDSLDELLQRLLAIFLESTAAADTAAVMLCEDGRLVTRAAAGLSEEVATRFTLEVGEGFSGMIAAERRPRSLRYAAQDPLVRSPVMRAAGVRALYGVPIVDGDTLIGVAHMGSRTAFEFSGEDGRVFRAMVERARGAIVRHRLQDELRRTAETLELGDACFVLDASYRIRFVNKNQERLSRKPRSETLGRVFWDVWPETAAPDSPYWIHYHRAMEARVPVEFDAYYAPLDLWTATSVYPTRDGGIAVFFRDATERKLEERRLAETAAWRQRVIGILGHDLRTPLGAILLSAQTALRRPDVPAQVQRPLARIEGSAMRMDRMLTDIVDWTRLQLGAGIPLARRPCDLAQVCQRVIAEAEAASPGRAITLETSGRTDGAWDDGRIAQLVQNLVGNALRHGDPAAPVEVAVRGDDGAVELAVHNAGAPIPPDLLRRIFEPFVQSEEPRGRGSLGLGLYIVREIARAHGGAVDVRSTDGTGTTFVVRLPRAG